MRAVKYASLRRTVSLAAAVDIQADCKNVVTNICIPSTKYNRDKNMIFLNASDVSERLNEF